MLNTPKVLIVDDDPAMCRSLKALLDNNGCVLETSNSGRDAVQRIENIFFDLVLLDLFMPDMTGFQVMDHINQQSPNTFVIVITGNSSEKASIEAIRKGAYDYIKKPFEPEKMLKTIENVLEQRKLVRERNLAIETLKQNEQKMKAILRASPVGIALVAEEKVAWGNETLFRMLGFESEMRPGEKLRTLFPNDSEYNRVAETIAGEMSQSGTASLETQLVRKDGKILDCMLSSCFLETGDTGKGCIMTISDISESKRLEAQIQRAQKMEAVGALAGGVAHDLNNILAGLVSYPELLLMKMTPDDPLRKPIFTIQKAGEKAAAIVQDLLTLARRGVASNEPVNLNMVIAQYLKSPEYKGLQSSYPDIKVECDFSDTVPDFHGSEAHLYKSVMNLLVNAAEAMPDGGKIVVSTTCETILETRRGYEDIMPGFYTVLKVSDSGIGISSKDSKRIFEPFYTKKKMGRSGTGLGMAVVWSTVKDHKGYIDLETKEGTGSVFTLYFPATKKKQVKNNTVSKLKDYFGSGESILIVDDVLEQREIAAGILEHFGYQTQCVSSGEKAVEYLKTHAVDLVVLDMIMDPGMDGLDTYKKIIEIHPDQKAIIASGYSETDRVKTLQCLGAGAYVKKPFLLEKLGKAVKEELHK
jgi:two-component system cell cycle sensor histidine kinase/response regulator CckA